MQIVPGLRLLDAVATLIAHTDEVPTIAEDAGPTHPAPRRGTLVELRAKSAHTELVLDCTAGRLTAYVLEGATETFERISQGVLDTFPNRRARTHVSGGVERDEYGSDVGCV